MAAKKQKIKSKKKKNKANLILSLMVFSVIALFAVTDHFGIFTYQQLAECLNFSYNEVVDGELSVHFIDVGQGDSILIKTDEYACLIDAGESQYGDDVVAYLNAQGVQKLDYVIATHPHSDHIGGLPEVLNNIETEKVIAPKISDGMIPTTKTYENFLNAVQNNGLKLTSANVGDVYEIGEAELKILAPNSDDYEDLNNYSVVSMLDFGGNRFLFTGDAETQSEREMLDTGLLKNIDVLKVGHHGSSTSSSKTFLEKISPDYAVIMVGADNSYNHPSEKTIDNLVEYTDNIYRTDTQGTIIFISDGEKISVTY